LLIYSTPSLSAQWSLAAFLLAFDFVICTTLGFDSVWPLQYSHLQPPLVIPCQSTASFSLTLFSAAQLYQKQPFFSVHCSNWWFSKNINMHKVPCHPSELQVLEYTAGSIKSCLDNMYKVPPERVKCIG